MVTKLTPESLAELLRLREELTSEDYEDHHDDFARLAHALVPELVRERDHAASVIEFLTAQHAVGETERDELTKELAEVKKTLRESEIAYGIEVGVRHDLRAENERLREALQAVEDVTRDIDELQDATYIAWESDKRLFVAVDSVRKALTVVRTPGS